MTEPTDEELGKWVKEELAYYNGGPIVLTRHDEYITSLSVGHQRIKEVIKELFESH